MNSVEKPTRHVDHIDVMIANSQSMQDSYHPGIKSLGIGRMGVTLTRNERCNELLQPFRSGGMLFAVSAVTEQGIFPAHHVKRGAMVSALSADDTAAMSEHLGSLVVMCGVKGEVEGSRERSGRVRRPVVHLGRRWISASVVTGLCHI